jgi:hypothetical protein
MIQAETSRLGLPMRAMIFLIEHRYDLGFDSASIEIEYEEYLWDRKVRLERKSANPTVMCETTV